MVNPGAFRGSRKEFLLGEKPTYSAGVQGGYAQDALANIQRRYFKRYPIDLPHDEEPSAEHLASVDDNTPEPEPEEPSDQDLSPEDYAEALKALDERKKLIVQCKAQIKRWLAYQYMKDNDLDPNESGARNPYRILLHQLTGTQIQRPRLKTATNVWRRTHHTEIEAEVQRQAKASGWSNKKLAPLRETVAKEMFSNLPGEEKVDWERVAKGEHEEALEQYNVEVNGQVSTNPDDRQRCIQGLTQFIRPILDLVCEATGWKASLIAGGPEPAHAGRLNVICVHSGTTSGDVKMNFGRAERARYLSHILPIYGDFLRKCYTPQECRSRALSDDEGFEKMVDMDIDDESFVNVDTVPEPLSVEAVETGRRERSATPFEATPPSCSASIIPSQPPSPVCSLKSTSLVLLPPLDAGQNASVRPSNHGTSVPLSQPATPAPSPARSPTPIHGTSATDLENQDQLSVSHVGHSTIATPSGVEQDQLCASPIAAASDVPHFVPAPSVSSSANAVPTSSTVPAKRKNTDPVGNNSRSSKRSRKSTMKVSITTTSSVVPIEKPQHSGNSTSKSPPNASSSDPIDVEKPKWFINVMEMFRSEDLGENWSQLVEEWGHFEDEHKFAEVRRLSSKGRPKVVEMWIARARSTSWRPEISNLKEYEKQFNAWWVQLQPGWRVSNGTIDHKLVSGDWDCLSLPGLNGLQSVLAALFYWGIAARKKASHHKVWISAVKDCFIAISNLRC